MFKKAFLILILSQIILNQDRQIEKIEITDGKPIEKSLKNENKIFQIHYNESKKYIQIKVQSTSTNPYIIFCQKQECNIENAYLISNLREKEQSLYINRTYLKENQGYIHINSYEESLEANIIFYVSDMIFLERDKSLYLYSPINKDLNIIKINRKNEKSNMILSVYTPNQKIENIIFYYNNGKKEKILSNVIDTDYGKVINLNEDNSDYNENSYYKISILSNSNAYIVINSKVFIDEVSNFTLNTLVFQGLINDNITKQCFNIKIDNNNDETININLRLLKGEIHYEFGEEKMEFFYKNDIEIIKKKSELVNNKMCFYNFENYDTVYILEIIDLNNQRNNINFYSPQINGLLYSRKIQKNKIVYYNFAKRGNEDFNKMTFYLQYKKGHPVMYQINCNSYPKCIYNTNNIDEYINKSVFIKTQLMNNMYFYTFETSKKNNINSTQNLLGVYCKGNEDCEYETLIFGKEDVITLKNDQRLSFHLQKGIIHKYKIEISNEYVHTIIFNVLTYSGDNIIDEIDYDYTKAQLQKNVFVTKQEFVFTKVDKDTDLIGKYLFSIRAKNNSFYSVEYEEFSNEKIDYIKAGLIYIESFRYNENRTIFITRSRLGNENINYYASFLALNCKITIYKSNNTILQKNYFVKDEISNIQDKFIKYTINVDSKGNMDDMISSKNEYCMVYISSIENDYNEKDEMEQKSIIISENVEQKVTLTNKIKGIKYIYPFTINKEGNIVFIFQLMQLPITISVLSNNNIIESNHKITTSRNYILERNRIICEKKNELCQIIIFLTGEKNDLEKGISFSFIIKSDDDFPQYIKKGAMIGDVISGKSINYYYTDIGRLEEGEILVNFERGKGSIYGRIVDKTIEKEENANWMGRFHFPNKNDKGTLNIDKFTNKILYSKYKTFKCEYGCYLLLSVENSVISIIESPSFLYQISIIAKITNSKIFQITEVLLDRFIISSFYFTKNGNTNKKQYYSFTLPYDAEKILLELQSDRTYLNISEISSTKFNIIFKPNKTHSIFEIKKNNLNLGSKFIIVAKYYNDYSYITEHIYSLRIRAIKKNSMDLIPVNSDQNTLCQFEKNNCFFLMKFSTIDKVKNLYIHVFQDILSSLVIYAHNFNESDIYNETKLNNLDEYDINTKYDLNKNQLLIDLNNLKTKYLIISVKSDHPGVIILLSSLYSFVQNIKSSPSAYQLFHLFKENEITLNFPQNYESYIAHFVCTEGNGVMSVYNTQKQYKLKGNSDIVGIIISFPNSMNITVKAIDKDFGFYIYYEMRSYINYDEIEYGTSGLIFYENIQYPLIYYSKLPQNYSDVNVIINLKNYTKTNYTENDTAFEEDLTFKIQGYILDKSFIYKKKDSPENNPIVDKFIQGEFDYSLKIAKINFTEEKIDSFQVKDPYLYVFILKGTDRGIYNKIASEYSVFPLGSNLYIAPYNQFIFGNLNKENVQENIYKLRINDKKDTLIQIEFSSNKKNHVRIAVMKNPPNGKNFTNQTKIEELGLKNGKYYLIIDLKKEKKDEVNLIEIYFIIYSIIPKNINFAFKYSSAENKNDFPIYLIKDNKVNYFIENENINNTKVILTLNTISKKIKNEYIKIPATYIAKVIDKFKVKKDMGLISFGKQQAEKVYKRLYEGNDSIIKMTLNDFPKEKSYYIVINAVTQEDSSEMFYYNFIKNPLNISSEIEDEEEEEEGKGKKKKDNEKGNNNPPFNKNIKIAIIILIIILIGFILILAIWFYKMKLINDDLKERINRLSQYRLDQEENEDLNYESINT